MRIVWTTDPHLNHVPVHAWERWIDAVGRRRPDRLVITGDISEGDDVVFQLRRIAESLTVPIHFVLGNHDFYQSSIGATRRQVIELCRESARLHYLTDLAPLELAAGVFLVGEDGWGDAKCGDYEHTPVRLNDFQRIDDFRGADTAQRKQMLVRQGQASAQRLQRKLTELPPSASDVLVATHVPPFRDACWYQGRTTDDLWAPFFVCGAVGDVLLEFSRERPGCRCHVVCGHTHHPGVARLAENLVVYTGGAEYGAPDVGGVVQIRERDLDVHVES